MFASHFSNKQKLENKKRQYSEISQPYISARQSAQSGTPFYTFDDNSTIKPNENTVIRNPTLMSLGIGQDKDKRMNKSHNIQPKDLN